ncbi:MAG: glycosyltransferase family 39 protein, partial [Anaerolineaceae bacterium]
GMIACFAVYEATAATPYGPAFGSDSVTYMESAKNLAAGKGLGLINPDGSFRLLPYAPPLYPLLLSVFVLIGLDLLKAAFWMNALIFGVTVFMLGWSVWYFLRSNLAALLIATLLAFSEVLIETHIWIMSDPLSLALGMGGLLTLIAYLKNRSRKMFFWSAVLTGLAFLTRYAGVAYCLAGILGVILFGSQSFKKRLVAACIYGVVSIIPMLIWLAIELPSAGAVGSRSLLPFNQLLPGMLEVLKALKEAMYLWLPYFLPLSQSIGQTNFRLIYISLFVLIAIAVVFAIFKFRKSQPKNWRWESGITFAGVMGLFLGLYFIVIGVSYAMIYPHLSLSNRMFAPINAGLLILVGLVIGFLYKEYRHWLPRVLTIAFAVLMAVAFYGGYKAVIAQQNLYPQGYVDFTGSGLIAYVRSLPEDTPIISDKATLILHFTGRPAYAIQEFFNREGQTEFLPYGSDRSDEAQRVFREQGGALVLTWLVQREFEGLYGSLAGERYAAFVKGLYLAYDSPEGKVYFYRVP